MYINKSFNYIFINGSDTCYTYMYIIVIIKIITILIVYILYNTYIEHFSLKSY